MANDQGTDLEGDESINTQTGQAGGSPPKDADGGNEDPSVVELRRKLTEQAEQLKGFQDLVGVLEENPDLTVKQIIAKVQGKETGPDPEEELNSLLGKIEDVDTRNLFLQVSKLTRDAATREFESKYGRSIAASDQLRRETQWDRDLRAAGVDSADAAVAETERELMSKAYYRQLKNASPKDAAEMLADRVKARSSSADGVRQAQKRVADAKAASLESKVKSGAPPTVGNGEEVIRPGEIFKLHKMLTESRGGS